jgi:ATP-dependent Zn protease
MNEIIDPIIAEVRKAREAYAEKFDYNIQNMCRDLIKRQKQNADRVIALPHKKIKLMKTA